MGNTGEALALGGVNNPQNTFQTALQGMQAGEVMRNRKAEKDAKADAILRESLVIKPDGYIPAIYSEVVAENERFIKDAQGLKEKVGRNYTSSPEFAQRKAMYLSKMANFKEESDRFNSLNNAYRAGTQVVDRDYIDAGLQSDYKKYLSYKNELTGEGVDPNTGRANVRGVPSYNQADILKKNFSEDDIDLYNIEAETRGFKGTKDYIQYYSINPDAVKRKVAVITNNQPEILDSYLIDHKADVNALMTKLANAEIARGGVPDPVLLRKAAARQLYEEDTMEQLKKKVGFKVDVPQYKPESSGSSSQQIPIPTSYHNMANEVISGGATAETAADEIAKKTGGKVYTFNNGAKAIELPLPIGKPTDILSIPMSDIMARKGSGSYYSPFQDESGDVPVNVQKVTMVYKMPNGEVVNPGTPGAKQYYQVVAKLIDSAPQGQTGDQNARSIFNFNGATLSRAQSDELVKNAQKVSKEHDKVVKIQVDASDPVQQTMLGKYIYGGTTTEYNKARKSSTESPAAAPAKTTTKKKKLPGT